MGQQDFVVASWSQMLWHSICLSYDQKTARVTVVSDGAIVSDFVDKDLVNFTASPVTGLQVNIMQNMNGKFTDLHIWNYRVNCKYFYVTDGNIMDLTDASRFLISCVIQHYAPVVGWGGGGTDV